jgi:hypothetical protein
MGFRCWRNDDGMSMKEELSGDVAELVAPRRPGPQRSGWIAESVSGMDASWALSTGRTNKRKRAPRKGGRGAWAKVREGLVMRATQCFGHPCRPSYGSSRECRSAMGGGDEGMKLSIETAGDVCAV